LILVQFYQHFEKNSLLNRAKFVKSSILVQFTQLPERNSRLNRSFHY